MFLRIFGLAVAMIFLVAPVASAKPDQAKPDQTVDVKPDQAKPDQAKPDQVKSDRTSRKRAKYLFRSVRIRRHR